MGLKLKILSILFFIFFLTSLIVYKYNKLLSSYFLFFCMALIIVGLFQFLSSLKIKRIKNISIEFVYFTRNYVVRTYLPLKKVWIIFDKKSKKFRGANRKDVVIKVILTLLFSLISMYISFLIILTIGQLILTTFRLIIAFILGIVGFYAFVISLSRLFSIKNQEALCKSLNEDKSLKKFLEKENAKMEITPNLLLTKGLVTSIELIFPRIPKSKGIEKIVVKVANKIK